LMTAPRILRECRQLSAAFQCLARVIAAYDRMAGSE
jgi:hypothetical protein